MFQLLMVLKTEFHKGKLTNVQVCKVDVSRPRHQLVVRALRLRSSYVHAWKKIEELCHTSFISLGAVIKRNRTC